jgi:hypothetical protein
VAAARNTRNVVFDKLRPESAAMVRKKNRKETWPLIGKNHKDRPTISGFPNERNECVKNLKKWKTIFLIITVDYKFSAGLGSLEIVDFIMAHTAAMHAENFSLNSASEFLRSNPSQYLQF